VATVLRPFEQLSDAALINTDEIDSDKKDMFAPYRDPIISNDDLPDEEFLVKIKTAGSEELQARIKTLRIRYKGIH
jgi:hypothetical protein